MSAIAGSRTWCNDYAAMGDGATDPASAPSLLLEENHDTRRGAERRCALEWLADGKQSGGEGNSQDSDAISDSRNRPGKGQYHEYSVARQQ
jgi:hypothetical protein